MFTVICSMTMTITVIMTMTMTMTMTMIQVYSNTIKQIHVHVNTMPLANYELPDNLSLSLPKLKKRIQNVVFSIKMEIQVIVDMIGCIIVH